MVLENVVNDDVFQCTRLFKSAFRIRNTPEIVKASRLQRIVGMASSPRFNDTEQLDENKENNTIFSSPINCNFSSKKVTDTSSYRLHLMEDFDSSSRDSGFEMTEKCLKSETFEFTEPLSVAPRKLSLEMFLSPAKQKFPAMFLSPTRVSHLRTLSSGYESTDDGFNELIDMETLESSPLPSGISSLISGEIRSDEKPMDCDAITPEPPRLRTRKTRSMRRALSQQFERNCQQADRNKDETYSPGVRSCLFRSPNSQSSTSKLTFSERRSTLMDLDGSPELRNNVLPRKRNEPPTNETPVLVKKYKTTSFQEMSSRLSSESETSSREHEHIKQALHRSQHFDDLTGDFSKSCALPLAEGKHNDLKSITPTTLAHLMAGNYEHKVDGFHIIDCRYPYEYEAGHIEGAVNLYSKEMIESFLMDPVGSEKAKIEPEHDRRSILVFHCEFSFERGPNMSRFLRSIDRKRNHDCYPALHYPEIYLLDGGYERFFSEYRQLCTPQGYLTMQDPRHGEDLKHFRTKSKSCQSEKNYQRQVNISKSNLKRLGF